MWLFSTINGSYGSYGSYGSVNRVYSVLIQMDNYSVDGFLVVG
jgi:hypothetical protein